MENFSDRQEKKQFIKKYLLKYTLIFILLIPIVFIYFFIDGKSFIWQHDGYTQHYKALVYYARWMREIIYGVLQNGTFNIPNFSLSFGLGADSFTTLQYYVVGDPITLFSVLIPADYMVYYYNFSILLRLYLIGLSFSAFALYNKKEHNAVLVGSMIYTFCTYSLFAAVRHPYFVNPMIYLPLLLLGVEKIRKENKPFILIGMVAISAMSNFYYFYMLALLVAFYVVLELFIPWRKDDFKNNCKTFISIVKYAVLGVIISALLFLPVVMLFLSDPRSSNGYRFDFFYKLNFYTNFLKNLITVDMNDSYTLIGTSPLVLLGIFLIFKKKDKEYLRLKVAFIFMGTALLLPMTGYALNGFAYVSNKWCWGFVFLSVYILVEVWNDLFNLSTREIIYLGKCLAIYFLTCILIMRKVNENYYFSLTVVLFLIYIFSVYNFTNKDNEIKKKNKMDKMILYLAIFSIGGNAYYLYSHKQKNYVDEFVKIEDAKVRNKKSLTNVIKSVNNSDEFFRYSGPDLASKSVLNESVINGLYNTQVYWSLVNGNIINLLNDTSTYTELTQRLNGFDSRTALETLASTKYFETKANDYKYVPYGFELVTTGDKEGYYIYENKHALPLGYTYSSSITKEQAEKFTPLERQEIMLQSVILEEVLGYNDVELETTSSNLDYEIQCNSDEITMDGNSFVVTKPDQTVTLTFEGLENSETYIAINDLQFKGTSYLDLFLGGNDVDPLDLYTQEDFDSKSFKEQIKLKKDNLNYREATSINLKFDCADIDDNNISKSAIYQTPKNVYYHNRKSLLVNLGYSDVSKNTIIITFPQTGIYGFGNIEVICQPMEKYAEQVELLGEDVLENVDLHENKVNATNYITGTISLDKPKILVMSIPYSNGWTAYVNGEETELLKANSAYMAIPLETGEHKIELRYHTPGLKLGFIISMIGVGTTIIIFVLRKRK